MVSLNEKEKAIYNFITDTIRRDGFSPSVRDVQNALNIRSTSTVHSYFERLEKKGYIKKESGKSRTVRVEPIVNEPKRTVKIPILSQFTIGSPVLAAENYEGYIDFPHMNQSYNQNQLFALRVKDSKVNDTGMNANGMNADGISDGDIVVVRKENSIRDGDIAVLLTQNKIMVVKYTSDMDSDEIFVIGKVISLIRFYE
ncbi:MAG: transcriptional repressor LexA [Oscillospiraceae bacterium]|nr:transcriptional repressor LexA [Oscillospiraceae bacterium]